MKILIGALLLYIAQTAGAQAQQFPPNMLRVWLAVIDKEGTKQLYDLPRGTEGLGFLKVTGCMADRAGNCNTEGDLKITNPNSKVDVNLPKVKLWAGKPPAPGEWATGAVFGVSTEPNDPLGPYMLSAIVRDLVSGQVVEVYFTIKITQEK